jgi:hypothetical protein
MKRILVLLLTMFSLGCGYSNNAAPQQPGVVPNIATLAPNNANAGDPTFVLTVNGTHFASNASVKWNGAIQPTTFVSDTQVNAMIPATVLATAGTAQVTVTNPGTPGGGQYGGGGTRSETSNMMAFTIN